MAMFDGAKEGDVSKESIIGADVTITGNMKSADNIQVNGNVKGKIETQNDVLVGETAVIDGSIRAKNVIVTGTIKGNIEVSEDLEIAPTGKIFGDVVTKNLIIKKGSIFVGKTTMPEGETPETDIPGTEETEESEDLEERDELIDKLEEVEPEKESQER